MNIHKLIAIIEKYILYIGLIIFCFALNFMIGYLPYLNLQREVVLTIVYLFVAYYIAYKLKLSSTKLLVILSGFIILFSVIGLVSFSEVLANVLFLLMVVQVIHMLRSSRNEN